MKICRMAHTLREGPAEYISSFWRLCSVSMGLAHVRHRAWTQLDNDVLSCSANIRAYQGSAPLSLDELPGYRRQPV